VQPELPPGVTKREALKAWLAANPWLRLASDGTDHAPSISFKIAKEAGLHEWYIRARWCGGRLYLLQQEALATAQPPADTPD
jgi:hypothetical protein